MIKKKKVKSISVSLKLVPEDFEIVSEAAYISRIPTSTWIRHVTMAAAQNFFKKKARKEATEKV